MTAIVELSSGQMIDLSGCLALNASTDSHYQLFLKGFQQPIELSESDGLQLKELLENRYVPRGFVVRTVEEQQQINQVTMEKLQAIIDRREQGKPSAEAEKFFRDFQEIVDEHRPVGKKLFQLRHDVQVGIEQLDQGQGESYTEEAIHQLFDGVKQQGRVELGLDR